MLTVVSDDAFSDFLPPSGFRFCPFLFICLEVTRFSSSSPVVAQAVLLLLRDPDRAAQEGLGGRGGTGVSVRSLSLRPTGRVSGQHVALRLAARTLVLGGDTVRRGCALRAGDAGERADGRGWPVVLPSWARRLRGCHRTRSETGEDLGSVCRGPCAGRRGSGVTRAVGGCASSLGMTSLGLGFWSPALCSWCF